MKTYFSVYLSSTLKDLEAERQAVRETLKIKGVTCAKQHASVVKETDKAGTMFVMTMGISFYTVK